MTDTTNPGLAEGACRTCGEALAHGRSMALPWCGVECYDKWLEPQAPDKPMLVMGTGAPGDPIREVVTIRSSEHAAELFGAGSPIVVAMQPPRLTLTVHLEEYYGRKYVEIYRPRVVLSNRTGWRRAVIRFALWVAGKAGAQVVVP